MQPQAGAARLVSTATGMSTDLSTPLALVPVTVKTKFPNDGEAEVVTVRVVDAGEEPGGMVTSEDDSATVTPVGVVPLQKAVTCAVSLIPFTDCSETLADPPEEAIIASDAGDANIV